jgi:hypothetical protein
LVARDVWAGFVVDGRVLSFHEGVRKHLNWNKNDILNGGNSAFVVHLPIRCSDAARMVLKPALNY